MVILITIIVILTETFIKSNGTSLGKRSNLYMCSTKSSIKIGQAPAKKEKQNEYQYSNYYHMEEAPSLFHK